MKPLLIEFVGLPGAGKTTLARRAAALLERRGYRCAHRPPHPDHELSRIRRYLGLVWFRLRNWRLLLAAVRFLASIRPFRWSRFQSLRHVLFLAHYHASQINNGFEIVLLDQSICQTMWASATPGDGAPMTATSRLLHAFHQTVAAPVALVYVDVEADTAAERAFKRVRPRVRGRVDRLSTDELRSMFTSGRAPLELIKDCAVRVTGAPLLRVDGSGSAATSALQIARFVASVSAPHACVVDSDPASNEDSRIPF